MSNEITAAQINDLRGSAQYSLTFASGADLAISPGVLLALLDGYEGQDLKDEIRTLEEELKEKDHEISLLEEECGDLTRELEGGARAD